MVYRDSTTEPDRSILVVAAHGKVLGLDRVTGEVRWSSDLRGGGHREIFIAIGYGVVIASGGGVIYCLDYLTGDIRWRELTLGAGRGTIVIEPDQIICSKGAYIDCFAPDGRRLWQHRLENPDLGRVAVGYPGNVEQGDPGE